MLYSLRKTIALLTSVIAIGLPCQSVQAQLAESELQTNPKLHWAITNETWKLPDGERMGMVGGHVLMDIHPQWQIGVASYGAMRGQRGGFITLGAEAQTQWPLSEDYRLTGNFFIGGGGGNNGVSLAGGGLMLRTSLGLEQRLNQAHRIGLGVSHVDFPNGHIHSTQPYLSYTYEFPSLLWAGWPTLPTAGEPDIASAKPIREQEFALSARHDHLAAGASQNIGTDRMQLLGVEWLSYLDQHWYITLGADGAMGGHSAGYMQLLLGSGYRIPLTANQSIKLHASVGPAGGGAADTGGGLLTDVGIGWQMRVLPRDSLELSVSDARAPGRSFVARSVGIKLVHHLQQPQISNTPVSASLLSGLDTERLRMRFVQQTYHSANPDWRCCNAQLPVNNLGLQLDYMLTPTEQDHQWFLTGQGIAAYKGEAGAYMAGLVGAGFRQQLSARWSAEAEALLGAAGGGGLRTGGGLATQVNFGLGYQLSPQISLLVSAGRMQSLHDSFKANVLGISAAYQFSTVTQR